MRSTSEDVVVITGGGGDIATAIGLALAPTSACIALIDRDSARLERSASLLASGDVDVQAYEADVRDRPGLRRAVAGAITEAGRIDVLVNVAGVGTPSLPTVDVTDDMYDDVFDSHMRGTFVACQAVIPAMVQQGSGRIVNTVSAAAFRADPGRSVYGAAKAAVVAFTRALAAEVGPSSVTANCVAPGLTASRRVAAEVGVGETADRLLQELGVVVHPRRMAEPAEIAAAVRYLCSPEASYVTGTTLHVNGGAFRG